MRAEHVAPDSLARAIFYRQIKICGRRPPGLAAPDTRPPDLYGSARVCADDRLLRRRVQRRLLMADLTVVGGSVCKVMSDDWPTLGDERPAAAHARDSFAFAPVVDVDEASVG